MVMAGFKGYGIKCEKCGYQDSVTFRLPDPRFFQPIEKILKGKKCPKCGGQMRHDPSVIIMF